MKISYLIGFAGLLLAAACTSAAPADVMGVSPTNPPVSVPAEDGSESMVVPAEPEAQAFTPTAEPTLAPMTTPEPTAEPVIPEPQPALTWLYGCSLELKDFAEWCWMFDGAFTNVAVTNLPADAKAFPDVYDFLPATNQVLVGLSDWVGAGPADMASTDLWLGTDPVDLSLQPLVYDSVVSEAQISPDGLRVAYVAATDTTYELRLLDLNSGNNELLAVDVAPDFSFSPDGRYIGFVRSAEWTLVGEGLGLYIISLETRIEHAVPLEAAGLMEVQSPLFWTPDSETIVILARYATEGNPIWELAVVSPENGGRSTISIAPDAVGSYDADMLDLNLVTPLAWDVEGDYFLANAITGFMTADMTFWILKYNLEPALGAIRSIDVVAEQAEFIGWDVPGESVWVRPSQRGEEALPFSTLLP